MSEPVFEIEVRATDANGDEAVVYGEHRAQGGTTEAAANEVLEAAVKEFGRERTRIIDADR